MLSGAEQTGSCTSARLRGEAIAGHERSAAQTDRADRDRAGHPRAPHDPRAGRRSHGRTCRRRVRDLVELTGNFAAVFAPLLCGGRAASASIMLMRRTAEAVRRQGDRAAAHLRRPGGDRDPERAAVQRDQRGAGAADGQRRSTEGHRPARWRMPRRCSSASSIARGACSNTNYVNLGLIDDDGLMHMVINQELQFTGGCAVSEGRRGLAQRQAGTGARDGSRLRRAEAQSGALSRRAEWPWSACPNCEEISRSPGSTTSRC